MLTNFYLDSEIFDDDLLQSIPQLNISILENWRDYGCLGYCNTHYQMIFSSLNKLQPKYKIKWETALSNFKKNKITPDKPLMSDYENFETLKHEMVSFDIDTSIISSSYLEYFPSTSPRGTFEIVSASNFGESISFLKSKKMSLEQIKKGDDINQLWENRFHNLAKHSKHITIIDRYSALNILEDHAIGKKTSLDLLIDFLSTTGNKYEITIYGACDIPNRLVNATELKSYLNGNLRKRPNYLSTISNSSFALCKNKFFGEEAHDRMISFDEDFVVEIGSGLDIFRDKPIKTNTFSIKRKGLTFFSSIYNELSKNREPGCTNI